MAGSRDHTGGEHSGSDHGGGGHSHAAPANAGRAFAIGIALNAAIVIVEAVFGFLSHSMALIADAGHNLSDVLGLALSWGASILAARKASDSHTYGLRKASILAALANAMLLLVATGAVLLESIERLWDHTPIDEATVIVVASVAVVINGGSALLFLRGKDDDLNIRSAYLHLAGDAAIALGVVAAGAVIYFTHWYLLDPITSIVVSLLILGATWSLFRQSLALALAAVPQGIDLAKVRAFLEGLPGVANVHDLHVWPISTTETALTAHLSIAKMPVDSAFVRDAAHELHEKFEIGHSTIQLETGSDEGCALGPGDAI